MRSRNEVQADKLAYFQSWPSIAESYLTPPKIELLKHGYARVRFRSEFTVSNPTTGEWRSGEIDNVYMLLNSGKDWKITSQEGKVSNSRKGTR